MNQINFRKKKKFIRINSRRNRKPEDYPNYYRKVVSDLAFSQEENILGLDGFTGVFYHTFKDNSNLQYR